MDRQTPVLGNLQDLRKLARAEYYKRGTESGHRLRKNLGCDLLSKDMWVCMWLWIRSLRIRESPKS